MASSLFTKAVIRLLLKRPSGPRGVRIGKLIIINKGSGIC